METKNVKNQICGSPVNGTDDREARSKFWIAAYTRPRSEKKAATDLAKGTMINPGIETYCPTQTTIKQWSDRKKKVETVVIPNIIFAHVDEADFTIVERNPLIVRVLRYPGQKEPAHIPDSQISQLKFMLQESDDPVEFVDREYKLNDFVEVVRGNLKGLVGLITKLPNGKSKLVLLIDLLGGVMVTIDSGDVRKL